MADADSALLEAALARLSATGQIEYTGEFGAEITTFIPFVAWLKASGHLEGRRVVTYGGMRPYYFFVGDEEYAEKRGPRHWLPPDQRDWPSNSTYTATRQHWHRPPDYRARYQAQGRQFERPVMFVQNKFTIEWDRGPVNYIPLNALLLLFERTAGRFDVVYSRPGIVPMGPGYTVDHQVHCHYPDLAVAREFAHVTVLEQQCADGGDYNLTKLETLAKAHVLVGVQGGGSHLLACFKGAVLLLLDYESDEYPHAYASGPYKYLADPPPVLLLTRSHTDFAVGVQLIASMGVTSGNVTLDSGLLTAFQALVF
jgi:hypothetical protein